MGNEVIVKMKGDGNDVSSAHELTAGLYVLEYTFTAGDDYPLFTVEIENVDVEYDSESVSEAHPKGKAGQQFSGRQKARLAGGRYIVSVTATGLSEWTVALVKP